MLKVLSYIIILVLLCSSHLTAQESETSGERLFQVHCQACHGPQGLGDGPAAQALDPPPRNLTVRPYKQGCGPGAIVHTLQNGVPESAMISYSETLTEEEMWTLARYVRSLQGGCCQDQ
jgi:mono/diheme cytochrome c family protein